jgi:hypothetical protein
MDASNSSGNFKFLINGMEMGTIANGETKEFTVPVGQHVLTLKNGWMRSPKYTFYIKDNETKAFHTSANKNAKWLIGLIVLIIVFRIGFRVLFIKTFGPQYTTVSIFIYAALFILYIYVRRTYSGLTLIEIPST